MIKKIPSAFWWSVAILLLLAALIYPALLRHRQERRSASCKGNLKNIGLLIKMYAQDYDDPVVIDSFNVLSDTGIGRGVFVCSRSNKQFGNWANVDEWTSYVILTRPDSESKGAVPFIRCKYSHADGTLQVYTDGHVEWVNSKRVGRTP